jgi:hypothetical protein
VLPWLTVALIAAGVIYARGAGRCPPSGAGGLDPGLQQALGQPAYATFVSEGRAGGIGLITALYPS